MNAKVLNMDAYRPLFEFVYRKITPLSPDYAPYRRLWSRVVLRAVADIVTEGIVQHSKDYRRQDVIDARAWIYGPSQALNSFERVCAIANIDPDRLRSWLKRLSREDKKRILHNLRHIDKGDRRSEATSLPTELPRSA
jgi:hypothetical protein